MPSGYFIQMLPLDFVQGAAQAPVVPGRIARRCAHGVALLSVVTLVGLGDHPAGSPGEAVLGAGTHAQTPHRAMALFTFEN